MLRVALTGGIASGKSAAAMAFRELDVPVIDTDRIARELLAPGKPGLQSLVEALGSDILDDAGALQRQRLRERIFSDPELRHRVNELLHPLILSAVERELSALDAPYVVVEIPLLVETGLASAFDRVLVIDAEDDMRIKRIMVRDGVNKQQARAALSAQAPRDARLAQATDIVENNNSLDALRLAVRELHGKYLVAAKQFASPPNRTSE